MELPGGTVLIGSGSGEALGSEVHGYLLPAGGWGWNDVGIGVGAGIRARRSLRGGGRLWAAGCELEGIRVGDGLEDGGVIEI